MLRAGVTVRRHRLFWKTAAAILALLVLAVMVPAVLRLWSEARRARAELVARAVATAQVAASAAAGLAVTTDPDALQRLTAALAAASSPIRRAGATEWSCPIQCRRRWRRSSRSCARRATRRSR
jgi:hypothetical protein